jgi:hypothetical protein
MIPRRQAAWIIVLISLLASRALAADDCETTPDLSVDLGPVHNQHCSNWCPYFTATDLLTQKLRKTGHLRPKERLHPLMVAATTFLSKRQLPDLVNNDGGSPDQSVTAVNWFTEFHGRLCRESDLGNATGPENELFQKSAAAVAQSFQIEGSDFGVTCPEKMGVEPTVDVLSKKIYSAARATWIQEFRNRCKVKTPPLEYHNDFNQARYDQLAEKNPPAANPETVASFRKSIGDSFAKGTIAAVLFKANFLKDPKRVRTAEELACGKTMAGSTVGSLHWASVVARKRNVQGVCEYKLRNSWGSDCAGMKEPEKCRDGYHWISRDLLEQKMANVQYIR